MVVTPDDRAGPRVLAGAPALDRRAFPRPGSVARWFEPFHVRQPDVARGEIAAQVAAGADVVVAPAWTTHRRALEAVGESRRAVAWTAAAARIAREAVETGLERRETGRVAVVVAGPLPDVAAGPEHATGRLLPASAAEERDSHDQAGVLADAGVDLLLLGSRPTHAACVRATRIAAETGLPVWAMVPMSGQPDAPPPAERVLAIAAAGAARVLLDVGSRASPGAVADALATVGPEARVGLVGDVPPLASTVDDLVAWLEVGASLLGLASGAEPGALAPLVEARDRVTRAADERLEAERASRGAWARQAAERAPGGRGLWLGVADMTPPAGFAWTVVASADALGDLPDAAFRLVVATGDLDPRALARLVERGGIVAVESTQAEDLVARLHGTGVGVQEVAVTSDGRTRLIGRREGA